MRNLNLREFVINASKKTAILHNIPKGYISGLPIIQILNEEICVTVPFFRFKMAKEDESLLYPIRYSATYSYPSGRLVYFQDLSYSKMCQNVKFHKAVGYFRHEAIKNMDKTEYNACKDELYELYDDLIQYLLGEEEFDEDIFKEKLNIIIEPSLIPIYNVIDPKFVKKFINIKGDN